MLLPGFGAEGQRRLSDSRVVVLGCGALGTVAADLLARAGVGQLVIVDRDYIELTNLQRQTLFDEDDVAEALPKAIAAQRRLARINSEIAITAHVEDVNAENIARIVRGAHLIVDGLDNLDTRYLLNDCAVREGIPYLYAGAVGSHGLAMVVLPRSETGQHPWEGTRPGASPCLRCVFPEPPATAMPTCDTVGVLAPLTSIMAGYQVSEGLKVLTGAYERVDRTLLNVDLSAHGFMHLDIVRETSSEGCICCDQRRFEFLEDGRGSKTTALCGRDAVQIRAREGSDVPLAILAGRLRAHGDVIVNDFLLRATLQERGERYELTLFRDGRAIVKGTDDAGLARSIYAKYVGT